MAKQNTDSFEKNLAALETLVAKLEAGDLSLEDSLKQFEQGINLARRCQTALDKAEQKVDTLLKKNASAASEEFSKQNPEADS